VVVSDKDLGGIKRVEEGSKKEMFGFFVLLHAISSTRAKEGETDGWRREWRNKGGRRLKEEFSRGRRRAII